MGGVLRYVVSSCNNDPALPTVSSQRVRCSGPTTKKIKKYAHAGNIFTDNGNAD